MCVVDLSSKELTDPRPCLRLQPFLTNIPGVHIDLIELHINLGSHFLKNIAIALLMQISVLKLVSDFLKRIATGKAQQV